MIDEDEYLSEDVFNNILIENLLSLINRHCEMMKSPKGYHGTNHNEDKSWNQSCMRDCLMDESIHKNRLRNIHHDDKVAVLNRRELSVVY
jgi:hypothetical protein